MTSCGLYSPSFEHDSCGIGFVANIKSNKSHQIVSDALTILENMEHRGAGILVNCLAHLLLIF